MTPANGVPRRERIMGVRVVGMKVAGLISLACAATILAGCAEIMDFVLPPKFSPEGQIWIDGLEADAKGDFTESLAKFSALANAGDPYAAWVLGKFYQGGSRVSRDRANAVRWYREAAAGGYAQAKYHLSLIEKRGWHEFHTQEVEWLKEDAEAGIVEAQYALGTYHRSGRGVKLSASEAARWWELSARRGYATSQASLALLYSKGDGVPRDEARAYAWLNLAAANLLPSAVKDIAVGLRDSWWVKLPWDQLSRSRELVMAFEETAEGAPRLALARGADVTVSEAPKPETEKVAETAVILVQQPATEEAVELTTGKAMARPGNKVAGEVVASAIPPPRDQFLLHLASFRTQGGADQEWQLLTRKFATLLGDLHPIIQSVDLGDRGLFYRVQAGPISSRASARALCRQIEARDQYCQVYRHH